MPVDPSAAGTGELPASAVRVALLTPWAQTVLQHGQEILPYRDKKKTGEGGECFI